MGNAKNKWAKKLWNTLRNSISSNALPHLFASNKDTSCDLQIANNFNNHFANVTKKLDIEHKNACHSSSLPSTHIIPTCEIPSITTTYVTLWFKDITINKSTGHDQFFVHILRLAFPLIGHLITDIINLSLAEASFPSQGKTTVATPLHKSGDPNVLSNYRPKSVLQVLSKIYERHILCYLQKHIDSNNIICECQSGFIHVPLP